MRTLGRLKLLVEGEAPYERESSVIRAGQQLRIGSLFKFAICYDQDANESPFSFRHRI
jgi:hypothetical protein